MASRNDSNDNEPRNRDSSTNQPQPKQKVPPRRKPVLNWREEPKGESGSPRATPTE